MASPIRLLLGSLALSLGTTACSSGGINAGEDGGIAFIGLTIMLVIGVAIMWFIMGRDE